MSEPKSEGIPYIGSRISLISKTDIRYEGLLFNIDTRQSMVALQNVRSFGTEGRRPDHIPPSDTVLQYATFKASEIKDLHVCEAAAPMPPPPPMQYQPPPPLPRQPPLPESQPPLPPAPKPATPTKAAPASSTLLTPGAMSNAQQAPPKPVSPVQQESPALAAPEPANVEPKKTQQQVNNTPSPRQPAPGRHEAAAGSHRTIPGMGGHLLKRKERRIGGDTGMTESELAADFDFSVGLHDFNKEQEYNKMSMDNADAVRPVLKGSYQKSSFFDTISCDALDRLEGVNGRMRAHEERKLNTETFGAVGLNNRRSYRGGRNGGRGNNRNRNNNNNSGNSTQNHNVFPNNRNGNGGRGQQRHYNNSGRGQQRQQVYQPRDQA